MASKTKTSYEQFLKENNANWPYTGAVKESGTTTTTTTTTPSTKKDADTKTVKKPVEKTFKAKKAGVIDTKKVAGDKKKFAPKAGDDPKKTRAGAVKRSGEAKKDIEGEREAAKKKLAKGLTKKPAPPRPGQKETSSTKLAKKSSVPVMTRREARKQKLLRYKTKDGKIRSTIGVKEFKKFGKSRRKWEKAMMKKGWKMSADAPSGGEAAKAAEKGKEPKNYKQHLPVLKSLQGLLNNNVLPKGMHKALLKAINKELPGFSDSLSYFKKQGSPESPAAPAKEAAAVAKVVQKTGAELPKPAAKKVAQQVAKVNPKAAKVLADTPEEVEDKKEREKKEKERNLSANSNFESRVAAWVKGLKKEVQEEMDVTLGSEKAFRDKNLPKTLEEIFEDDMLSTLAKLNQRNNIKPAWLGGYVMRRYKIEYNHLKEMLEGADISAPRIKRTLMRADMREFLWVKSAYYTVNMVAKTTKAKFKRWYAGEYKNDEIFRYMIDEADLEDRAKMERIVNKVKERYKNIQIEKQADADPDLKESKNNRLQKLIKIITSEKLQSIKEEQDKDNPYAICTDSVGRKDKEKYERCVIKVKKSTGYKKK